MCGGGERSIRGGERVADVLARWEKAPRRSPQFLLLRKHLFLPPPLSAPPCPAELHLLYHQLLHQLRADRLPVSPNEAVSYFIACLFCIDNVYKIKIYIFPSQVMLVALQAQVAHGDAQEDEGSGSEAMYNEVGARTLPPRLGAGLSAAAVRHHHLALRGTAPAQAKQSLLNLLQSWPLHAATVFDVMV